MKQHIDKEQAEYLWNKYGDKIYERLKINDMINWEFEAEQYTIGKMIEILDEVEHIGKGTEWVVMLIDGTRWYKEELCDALWEAVKYVLEQEEE